MPDVRVDYDPSVFLAGAAWEADLRSEIAHFVARELSCLDDDGGKVEMNGVEHIDIFMRPFGESVHSTTADVIITITGYDYADRMRDIDERLKRIGIAVKGTMRSPVGKRVSLMFVPIPAKCWVAV